MKKLIYLPLEPYVERYTYLMSKKGGWTENHFDRNNIEYIRVEGKKTEGKIKVGSVVDAFGRSLWAMDQTAKVIDLIQKGEIVDGDVIYTEDFWHPGVESLFYIRSVTGIKFQIGCFMHAQSIDDSDFTHSMKDWIGDIERGYSKGYDYVFVTSPLLEELAVDSEWDEFKIYLTGLPLNKDMLLQEYGHFVKDKKEKFVLFSSRFDEEKNPHFFLDLVFNCPEINFKLVKPREKLSNLQTAEDRAYEYDKKLSNFEIVDTSSKEKYYELLGSADVQFNCAKQDWVSWTLLEAVSFKCKPLYPIWKDFPYELEGFPECLYANCDIKDAEKKLKALIDLEYNPAYMKIADKHNKSWDKKLKIMGF